MLIRFEQREIYAVKVLNASSVGSQIILNCHLNLKSKQRNEFVNCKICIPEDGAQQWFFNGPA